MKSPTIRCCNSSPAPPAASAPDLLEAWYGFLLVSGNAYRRHARAFHARAGDPHRRRRRRRHRHLESVAELWAYARPITGDERLAHDQLAGRLTHEVWIRYRAGVVPAMRFRQASRIYEIVAVIEAERRSRLKCLCEERSL